MGYHLGVARLHEYQGKALLAERGIEVPRGRAVRTPQEAATVAREIGGPVVLKVQAWITGRAERGGVIFAEGAAQAEAAATKLLAMRFGNFPVTEVLVEEKLQIAEELFVSFTIDDAARAPVLLLDLRGGTGIEGRAASVARVPVPVQDPAAVRTSVIRLLDASPIRQDRRSSIADAIVRIVELAKAIEARSLEVNPLVTTADGRVLAADCRITIDDYAVFRHPELGIEIARELDHPPTELERIAYGIEQARPPRHLLLRAASHRWG